MSIKPAIRADGLWKEYVIGASDKGLGNFRELLIGALTAPVRRLRRMQGKVGAEERFWALQDVGFTVNPGEVVGIVGRNGSGKSTLLKLLSRITEPTRGEAEIYGRVSSLLEVGTGFHPELTGRENIFLNGAILGMRRAEIERKFDEIVAFAEVERFLDTVVKHYSSGMYVRLAFAVAAHLDSEILLVDEVLAVGDAKFQDKCLGRMSEVVSSGRTVFFVSHNMATVRTLCPRVLVLESGRLIADASADEGIRLHLAAGRAVESRYRRDVDSSDTPFIREISIERPGCCYGESVDIDVVLWSPQQTKLALEVEIRDRRGIPIALSAVGRSRSGLQAVRGGEPVPWKLSLGPLLLADGEYNLFFSLFDHGAYLDGPRTGIPITVSAADPFGSGRPFSQALGRGCFSVPLQLRT
jgi:lipopolysaccharide transport system ATP-binding protein